ncbi:MAG TPA: hypothetical protein VKS01_11325 [Bryobacteraceae bacterium]|nr:hypothetical protein [Bryobacteraceae bacterium]
MITPTSQAQSADTLANLTMSLPASSATSAESTDPFAQQLATALEQFLGESSASASSTLEINVTRSQVSDGSQLVVTITDPNSTNSPAATPSATASTATPPASTGSVLDQLMPTPAGVTPGIYNPSAKAAPATIDKSKMTPYQAYWAEQPPAVQALQNMDPADRGAAAQQLAAQGYQIDVPIMVWGWDPLATMIERQSYGYTWVPSASGSPVDVPPGVSFPGLPAYDAANPQPGSIQVSTAFAEGTNMQDAFVDPATMAASFPQTVATT